MNFLFSTGFRSPNIDDLGKIRENRGVLIIPNPELKPEYVYNFEGGLTFSKDNFVVFPESLDISGKTARELNRDGLGVIRFYPQGDSSGGEIDIIGKVRGVRLSVDWLLGRVSQSLLDVD